MYPPLLHARVALVYVQRMSFEIGPSCLVFNTGPCFHVQLHHLQGVPMYFSHRCWTTLLGVMVNQSRTSPESSPSKQAPWLQRQEVETSSPVTWTSALNVVSCSVPRLFGSFFFCSPVFLKIRLTCPHLPKASSSPLFLIPGHLYCIFLFFIPLLPLAAKSLPHLIALWLRSICILSLGTFQHAALLPFSV